MNEKKPEGKDEKQYLPLEASFENWAEETIEVTFRFAKPSKAKIEHTNAAIQKDKGTKAIRNFLVGLIHPDESEKFIEYLDEYPGLVQSFSDAIYRKLGFQSVGK
ncbi:MAG: hypothetical protein AB7E76_02845 [Deferribacterales bacterium]